MSNPPSDPPALSVSTNLQLATRKANLQKAKAEVMGQHIKNITEAVKSFGIVLALLLGAWANCTKASTSDVKESNDKTRESFKVVASDIEQQHAQSEKIRETVKGTAEAVESIAGATPSEPGIVITNKEPAEKGCWTVYGGIVKCKGLKGQTDAVPPPVRVEVPPPPPPAPIPTVSTSEGERFGF